ncbi:helix-turn-helix domain-containing protein [Dysgonomonas sp. ZJ279]|uniref:helix-turn-helix domain-containing protein n=1 Tax=Dysgonomonas sp. ZJ279 TaxID=2709796 RepID=UPI0013EAB534|nr:helix-turn-helix transcriptional regulator [Dysgonomonas sp. ZJ279]
MNKLDKIKKTHHGHNVRRMREVLGIKQGALAIMLDMPQQTLSDKEAKEIIDDETLDKISKALNVPLKVLQEMKEDPATIIFDHPTFAEGSIGNVGGDSIQYNSPVEKIIELTNEKVALYERMLELEKEKIAWLEKLLSDKK